jgi:HEAT repeat protein
MLHFALLPVLASGLQQDPALRLPDRPAVQGQVRPKAPPPLTELQRFRLDLQELAIGNPKSDVKLQEMAQTYRDEVIEPLILEVARVARAREMQQLTMVARRFPSPAVADELLFQLLARPLGDATRDVLETMAVLRGDDAHRALRECVRGKIAGVRRGAIELLARTATADELPFALQISSEPSLDLQLCGIVLLAAIPDEQARARLVELLAKDPTVAGAACDAMIRAGAAMVPALQQVIRQPPIDRAWVYAAFALAEIGERSQTPCLEADVLPTLRSRLDQPDALTRALAAVAIADQAFRSDESDPKAFRDADVVAALIDVVQPDAFVPNLELLKRPAEVRLARLSGRAAGGDGMTWREWWTVHADGFLGMRERVQIDAATAALAIVSLRSGKQHLRVIGEGLADLAPVAGAIEVVVDVPQMLALVETLNALGFAAAPGGVGGDGLPRVRQVQMQVQGVRAHRSAPADADPRFDPLQAAVFAACEAESWQWFRSTADEPERGAFWRAERRWRDANPDPLERHRRLVRRIVKHWPTFAEPVRDLAVQQLFALPAREQVLTEADGRALVDFVRAAPAMGEAELRLLELATQVPGDAVWRDAIDVAQGHKGGSRAVVQRLFGLLGAERVLAALADERPDVRRVAIDQVVVIKDLRAGPRLVELLEDPDRAVQQMAVFACGQLRVVDAQSRIVQFIVADATDPKLRHECLRAVGRLGGAQAFSVLQRALLAPDAKDRDAALRGLGEMTDPRAAALLAELVVVQGQGESADLARHYLQRMGSALALPALRAQLATQKGAARKDLVLLLAAWQDPEVVPDLIDLMRSGEEPMQSVTLLSGILGRDVGAEPDRFLFAERWLRDNRGKAHWQWYLPELRAQGVQHGLRAEMFGPDAGLAAVPELARLLVVLEQPYLRVLTAAVLRAASGQDYGLVNPLTPVDIRESIAARYKVLYEGARAAQGK